jgi:predicted ribosome quality control (RQC) complex YloA/Tae2 family protein
MDFHLLSQVIDELSTVLAGARVERVYQDVEHNLCIVFNRARKSYILLLSPDRTLPRLHLVSRKPAAAGTPAGFVLYLRSHLPGATVSAVGLVKGDRIADILFKKTGKECRLIFELFGPRANLFLIDRSSKILAVYHPVPPGEQVARPLLPGIPYLLPEKRQTRPGKDDAALRPLSITEEASSGHVPVNRSVELLYERLLRERQEAVLRRELSSALKKALSRVERRVEAVSGDLAAAEKADDHRRAGELILANLRSLRKGAESAELSGYDGRTVMVRLDPRLSPGENADRYFRRYKKAKAGLALITRRLAEARAGASSLRELLSELAAAEDIHAITALHGKLVKKGLVKGKIGKKNREKKEQAAPAYRKFGHQGWEIFVGRSAAGNDELTLKLARPDDLWLHAEGMPGSHVLVRNPKAGEVPPDVLMKAASLAAYYSKGRGAGKVPVAYTPAKFVKKPKGAKPGTVTLSRRRTVMAKPEEGL